MGIPLLPRLSNLVPTSKTSLLVLIATAMVTTGCVSNQPKKNDGGDIFAAYSVDEILEAGNESFDNQEFERAVFIYMQALEIEQNAETWYRIGLGKSRLGDKAYAWQALKKSIELDPNHALSLQELGLINLAIGEPAQAELHLARATEIDPTLWRAWNARGVIADIDHRYEEAVLYYQSGLIGTPNSSLLMNNIGYSYYLAGNLQEATRWFGRAIMTTPDYEPAIKNLGLLYARQGWYDEAVKTFSKVVEKRQAYNDTGYLALRNGDIGRASELISEAIRLSPRYFEKAYENL
jgi:Flp pilus assembly protein TadD